MSLNSPSPFRKPLSGVFVAGNLVRCGRGAQTYPSVGAG